MKHLKSRAIRSVDNEWCTKEMQKECQMWKTKDELTNFHQDKKVFN
jgi:hypothetical protein